MKDIHLKLNETNTSWCGKRGTITEDIPNVTCENCIQELVNDWGYEAVYNVIEEQRPQIKVTK